MDQKTINGDESLGSLRNPGPKRALRIAAAVKHLFLHFKETPDPTVLG
jgi:hypothetical protein